MSNIGLPGPRYYDQPADWERIVAKARGNPAGFDTEFYNVDLRSKDSTDTCCGKAIVHVWSLALLTKRLHPRGFYSAVSAVFPARALVHPAVRAWLTDADSPKIGLNTPVDAHATENTIRLFDEGEGIVGGHTEVRGTVDIINLFRWAAPERVAPGPGYTLDSIGRDYCGRGKIDSFEEVLSEPNVVDVERRETKHRVVCECGAQPCRKPTTSPGHARSKQTTVRRWMETVVRGERIIPLETVLPGHPRWERLVPYSGVDSELGLEGWQVATRMINDLRRPVPW